MKLIGLAELSELYGVSKNTANTWARRHDFPAPVVNLKMGPVWSQEEVESWRRPASKQTWQPTCGYCASPAVTYKGMTPMGATFAVDCIGCEKRTVFKIETLRPEGVPNVTVSILKEDL